MELDKSMIESIIREVIREEMQPEAKTGQKHMDASGVMGWDPNDFKLEPFPFPINADNNRVLIADFTTVEESPRVGSGIMEMDNVAFDWTLTYDEIDYIIEGTLDIIVEGRTTRATAGQMLYIPKNTKITFSTPDKTRFAYVVYPANWSEC